MKNAYAARFASDGADVVVKDFDRVGRAGERAGRDIAKGAKGISPAMRGVDTAVGEARKGLDGFAGRAGAFGGILQSMGPLGLAAAAGIGAMGAAFSAAVSKGTQAIEWAESLDLLSERLNTSARSVQEWRFAASQFGVDASKTDAALEKLNNTIGLASRGIPKATKLFQALGFTDDQIAGFRDVDSVLPQVAEKLAALEPAARAGLANKLGLSELLPLLRDGRVGVEDLKKQFEELGLVIDDGALRRAAEDNDRLDVATARAEAAQQRFNLALTGSAAAWGEFKANAAEAFEAIFGLFQELDERSTGLLEAQRDKLRANAENAVLPSSRAYALEQARKIDEVLRERNRANMRARASSRGERSITLDDEDAGAAGGKAAAKIDPVRAALEARIKSLRETALATEGLLAVEREFPGLSKDEVKARYELIQTYKQIDAARAAGIITSDAEVQQMKDWLKANEERLAGLRAREEAEKVAADRQSRADSARQFFETPLMRYKREAAELRDLQQGGELSDEDARRGLRELNKEYEELAARQFEASDAGQLLGGILNRQIRNVRDLKVAILEIVQQKLMEKLFGQLGALGDSLGGGGKSKGGIFKSILSAGLSLFSGGKSGGANSHSFGGGRANGGPVQAGMFYRVNENTPNSEWFAPAINGAIFNHGQMQKMFGGGGGPVLNYAPVIDARGADETAVLRLKAQLDANSKQLASLYQNFKPMVGSAVKDLQSRRVVR